MYKIMNVMIIVVLLLILMTDSTKKKCTGIDSLVYLSKTEVLVPLGNETLLLSDSLTSGLSADTCLILNGKEFIAKKDSDENTIDYLQKSVIAKPDLKVVGVISLDDVEKLKEDSKQFK